MTGTHKLRGIVPAIITPFTNEGKLDEQGLRETLRYLIKSGVHGLMVNGSTGEAANLSQKERKRTTEVAVSEAKGELPVVTGTGDPSTEVTVSLTRDAKEAGADAAMIVTPYYLIPNEEGLIKHYKTVAKNVDIPIVIYNIPAHTKVNLTAPMIAGLCKEVPNILGLKDSSGNLSNFAETIKLVGEKIAVMTGCDDLLLQSFVLGASGAIVAIGNIAPTMVVQMFDFVKEGKIDKAREIYFKLLPIAKAIGSEFNFPAPVKEAIRLLGRPAGPTRSPIVQVPDQEKEDIRKALKEAGLL
jgi:4-hydroxy-tetrahydrodipicolinate synthase